MPVFDNFSLFFAIIAIICAISSAEVVSLVNVDHLIDIVRHEQKPVIVMHYEDWDGHSRRLEPLYAAAEAQGSGTAFFTKIKCSHTQDTLAFCTANNIRSFPAITAFDGQSWSVYTGSRTTEMIQNFANNLSLHPFTDETETLLRSLMFPGVTPALLSPGLASEDDSFDVAEVAKNRLSNLSYPQWSEWSSEEVSDNREPKLILYQDVSEDSSVALDELVDNALTQVPDWKYRVIRVERGRAANSGVFMRMPVPSLYIVAPTEGVPQPVVVPKEYWGVEQLRLLLEDALAKPDFTYITTITAKTSPRTRAELEEFALENGVNIVLVGMEKWSYHYRDIAPALAKAAKRAGKGQVVVFEVECSLDGATQALCKEMEITVFPTLKIFSGRIWRDLAGPRSSIGFYESLMGTPFIPPVSPLERFKEGVKGIWTSFKGRFGSQKADL